MHLDPSSLTETAKSTILDFLQEFHQSQQIPFTEWHKAREEHLKHVALQRLNADLDQQIAALERSLEEAAGTAATLIAQRDSNIKAIEGIESEIKANKLSECSGEMEEFQQMMLQLNSYSARLRTQQKLQY